MKNQTIEAATPNPKSLEHQNPRPLNLESQKHKKLKERAGPQEGVSLLCHETVWDPLQKMATIEWKFKLLKQHPNTLEALSTKTLDP